MSKFKVGDTVRIRNNDDDEEVQSKLSDLQSDLLCDINEGDITGKVYDLHFEIIAEGKPVTVSAVAEDSDGYAEYELKFGDMDLRYMYPEFLLEAVT